jgi:hypothetical protein
MWPIVAVLVVCLALLALRSVRNFVADLLRGAVRCMFPIACLAVLAGLVDSDQGRDVLIALIEFAAGAEHGHSIAGLLFLLAGCVALGLSVWYSMRWLLGAEMAALPLPDPPDWAQRWLPRLLGAAAPAMVAFGLFARDGGHPEIARPWAFGFAGVALALVLLFAWRGDLLVVLRRHGWVKSLDGREGARPGRLGVEQKLPDLTLRVVVWSIVSTFVIGLLMFLFPVTLPRVIGAAAVAAIALASINLFGSFVLTYWPLRHGLPPLALWALLFAALIGAWNDNHQVATVEGATASPRAALADDFERFLGKLQKPAAGAPTVLFVASEGGGIRAAYWTAAVLERLAEKSPELLRHHLYALSGVSGGSLGVASWVMSHRTDWCPQAAAEAAHARSAAPRAATASLGMDFVAPAVAGLFYYDLAQRFWPLPIAVFDRSRAIEAGWQSAFANLPGQPFEQTMDSLYGACEALPRLLLNTTVVETGQRAVLGPLALDPKDDDGCQADAAYLNVMPAMAADLATRRQPLAGLVHHSARFPVISPAGTVTRPAKKGCPPALRLVDGGYFDNSGAQTVLDLVLQLRQRTKTEFRPLVLLVRNSASPLCAQEIEKDLAPSRFAPEATSVVRALANARGSHAVVARAALLRAGVEVIDLAVRENTDAANAPLGWALSDQVRRTLDAAAESESRRAAAMLAGGRHDSCSTRTP